MLTTAYYAKVRKCKFYAHKAHRGILKTVPSENSNTEDEMSNIMLLM